MWSAPNAVPPIANGEYAFGPTRRELRAGPAGSSFNRAQSHTHKLLGLCGSAIIHVVALAALYFGHGEHASVSPKVIPITLTFLATGDTPRKTKSPGLQKASRPNLVHASTEQQSLYASATPPRSLSADTRSPAPIDENHTTVMEPAVTLQQSDVRKVEQASVPNVTEPDNGKQLPIGRVSIAKVDDKQLASSSGARRADHRQSYEPGAQNRTSRAVPIPERRAVATAPRRAASAEQSLVSDRGDKEFFEESNIASTVEGLGSGEFGRPRSLHGNRPPIYPQHARELGQQGKVVVVAEVMPDGHCGRVSVIRSSGYAELDDAARDAILSWRFTPAVRDGRKIVATIEVPVRFRLTD